MTKAYKYYSDPGHGWLAVKVSDLTKVGLYPANITAYSYHRGGTVYLEEDCDMGSFITAYRSTFGTDPRITAKSTNKYSPIRSYASVRAAADYMPLLQLYQEENPEASNR